MMKKHVLVVFSLVLLAGCLHTAPRAPQPPPEPSAEDLALWNATCEALYLEVFGRTIDESGRASCLEAARLGGTSETLREGLKQSTEYADRIAQLERDAAARAARYAFRGPLHTEGTLFVAADGQPWLPVLTSAMALPSVANPIPFLDWLTGKVDPLVEFNGGRLFVGALNWHDLTQTALGARAALPGLLQEFRNRGRYVLVTAITDSRHGGYDVEEHLTAVRDITLQFDNVLLEVANEPYHGTQADSVNDVSALCAMARRVLADYPHPWALGAGSSDHPVNGVYDTNCGTFNTVHLRRGQPADMLAAMEGLREIMRVTNKPVLNSEMIGAAERDRPGSRLADPEFFGRAAAEGVRLGFGSLLHSDDGLYGRVPGPTQTSAARAFVAGMWSTPLVPVTPDGDPCAAAGADPVKIVGCHRARYDAHLSRSQLEEFLLSTTRMLNARAVAGGPWGMLVKTGGNNCNGWSCDIICSGNGPEQTQVDVLIDERLPTWSMLDKATQTVRPCEVR